MTYSFVRLNYRCTSPVGTLCNGLNLTWAIAHRHVSYWEKHQYRFLLYWGFHWDRFWAHYFFNLHQWFATFYTKFWNWYVCRWHYHLVIIVIMCEITCIQQSLQESLDNANCWFSLNRMKPNAKKNKANVNWNCSKALLCRQDMHEFILVSHLESAYWLCY